VIKPILSIIIVSYNTKNLLKQCLESLIKNDRRLDFSGQWIDPKDEEKIPAEIIVVDNGSTDGSVEYLLGSGFQVAGISKSKTRNQKPEARNLILIRNDRNVGFAKANNQGIKIARGEYILLLNSDTIISEGAISQTLYWLSSHAEAGVITCRLLNKGKTIQATGGFFPNLLNTFTWAFFLDDLPFINKLIKPFHPHPPQFWLRENWYNETRQLDWVTGAFFMIKRGVIREAGKLDEKFFMYVEETEWCYRIKKLGWQVFYYSGAKIIHLGGGSGQKATSIKGENSGLTRFFFLHRPKWQLPVLKIILKLKNLLRIFLFLILGKIDKAKAYYESL